MESILIKDDLGKIIAVLYSFLDVPRDESIIRNIISKIPKGDYGYAGFINKRDFTKEIGSYILSPENATSCNLKGIIDVLSPIKDCLRKCSGVLDGETLEIFVFPTFDNFIKDRMFGVFGNSPWRNTIHLYINSLSKKQIKFTLAHEIAHAISPYPTKENSIGASMLYEGIAEKFRESFFGGAPSPWSLAVSKDECKKILSEIDLKKVDFNLYNKIFFGSKKYPLWAGYSIGYMLAQEHLKKTKNPKWKDILREDMNNLF